MLVSLCPSSPTGSGRAASNAPAPSTERRRAFEAVAAVLRGLAAERPTLLLLDDLHNAGLATVELLHYLARRAGGARLLVSATVRAEEGADLLDTLASPPGGSISGRCPPRPSACSRRRRDAPS